MSGDPAPEHEHLQSLYEEVRSLLEGRGDVSVEGQAIVLMRIVIENGGAELGMTGIMHVVSSMMTQTLDIMSENEGNRKTSIEDVLSQSSEEDLFDELFTRLSTSDSKH